MTDAQPGDICRLWVPTRDSSGYKKAPTIAVLVVVTERTARTAKVVGLGDGDGEPVGVSIDRLTVVADPPLALFELASAQLHAQAGAA